MTAISERVSWAFRSRRLATLVVTQVILLVLGVTMSGSALAVHRSGDLVEYSYKTGECGVHRAVDPISIIFVGGGAFEHELAGSSGYSGDLNMHKGSWTRHSWDSLFKQSIIDWSLNPATCEENRDDTDLATADGLGHERGHLRMWTLRHKIRGNYWTMMTPHLEDWQWWTPDFGPDCGSGPGTGSHFVKPDDSQGRSGFDKGRNRIYQGYRGGAHHHRLGHFNLGNTYSAQQCNGSYVNSSGGAWAITIGHVE